MANNRSSNKIVVPEAKQALNQMKLEIANEFGLSNYEQIDGQGSHTRDFSRGLEPFFKVKYTPFML